VLRGKYRKHDALLAWAARNLLELWVWSAYVTRSEENLKRFNDDLLFDARDIVAALSLPAPYDPEGALASGYPAMDLLPNEKSRVWDVIGML